MEFSSTTTTQKRENKNRDDAKKYLLGMLELDRKS
jgi:hypothetical protein